MKDEKDFQSVRDINKIYLTHEAEYERYLRRRYIKEGAFVLAVIAVIAVILTLFTKTS